MLISWAYGHASLTLLRSAFVRLTQTLTIALHRFSGTGNHLWGNFGLINDTQQIDRYLPATLRDFAPQITMITAIDNGGHLDMV